MRLVNVWLLTYTVVEDEITSAGDAGTVTNAGPGYYTGIDATFTLLPLRRGRMNVDFRGTAGARYYADLHEVVAATQNASAGMSVQFTRRRVGSVWLPMATRFDGTGRALMVRKVVIEFRRDYSDYQRFEAADLPTRLGWSPAP